ncbi:MAG TPA: TonB-dependent siderophore receptor [Sphingobium sp.]|uniref:TonB-dependent receptor n=1 Tax=Sphingobium sp. TaxID=1912891 RepID=UPI002ED55584
MTSVLIRQGVLKGSSVLALAFVLPGAVHAQSSSSARENRVLGSVTVTDTTIEEREAETSYKVTRNTSGMRTDTPLIDVPQSVNVITVKQIEDQAANNIGEAIRYIPGVFSAQGEGNRETLLFRGNSTTGDFFVDGVRDDVQTYRDLYNIEQLQVFRGPNAMIFGRGGIGGVINRVTKVADWRPHRAFSIEGGSFSHKRASFDLGAAITDAVAVRMTGVQQDSESYRYGVLYKRWGLNPTVSFRAGEDTTFTLGYEHFQDDRIADRGVSSYAGKPLDTPRGEFFGNARQSPTSTNTDAVSFAFEHHFNDAITVRNHTRYADYEKFYQNVFAGVVFDTTQTVTSATTDRPGLAVGTYDPGTVVAIQAYNNATRRKNFISQTDLNAGFDTGGIRHTILFGFEYGRQTTDNLRLEGVFNVPGVPAITTGTLSPTTVYTRISSPTVNYPISWVPGPNSTDNHGVATVIAGYLQDQIDLSPMFQIVAGIRFENFRTEVTNRRTGGFPPTQQRQFNVTDNLWSPRAALIFKPVKNASLYIGYSRTYLPRGGDQLASLSLSNQSLAPEEYQNYEIGAKWDVNPGFNVQAALFQLDRSNVLALSNPNDPSSETKPIGRQRTRGVELSVAGNITDTLSMVGAYTYTDAFFRDSTSGTVRAGNKVGNVPEHAASLWTRYDPTRQIGAGLGVIYQGKRYASTDNAVSMDSYVRVDGALYYNVTENVGVQLNVENILGERYFLYANSNTNITPGSPTAFKAGVNVRF